MAQDGLGNLEPASFEEKWYQYWQQQNLFHAAACPQRPAYSMVIPPPNVTGVLHMGHALNNTLQDILARWRRMAGDEVLWMPGTDHAGIATQNVVEKQLAEEGQDRHNVGRQAFVQRVWQWRQESGGQIINQLKRLGASCDWPRERFTMDEGLSRAVREVFVRLYEEGLIYRAQRLINWCPRCHTALSDLEVEHEDHGGQLWHLLYPVAGTDTTLCVATTRPETMLGDTAVAVHPEDERYAHLIGNKVRLPLLEREIPIIADEYVEREFGSGAVKITPAHDFNDFAMGQRHGLEMINILDASAQVNANGGPYAGLDRYQARQRIVADLEQAGLLAQVEEHTHAIGACYRCKTVIEPYLSLQWFVNVGPMARQARAAVAQGQTRIVPQQWEKTYYEWLDNIQDWCISRQIWWGHRIPAWYCQACGEISVSRDDPQQCSACGSSNLVQDEDVLDTWFSSALWPFTTLGWPEQTPELAAYYPTSCLVTGFDILFFWVARMMMMGLHIMGTVPFRDVYIHALVRDEQGQKMSKSKGNVIDPLVTIEEYGADAFRFTLAAFAAQGRDVKLSKQRIAGYRNFVNKLWNAGRYTLMQLGDDPVPQEDVARYELSTADRWILTRLNQVAAEVDTALTEYKFNEAAGALYAFTWHEFCDWYVELSKGALYGDDARQRQATLAALVEVLQALLKLLHPFMPFVTEEIWHSLPAAGPRDAIMLQAYPQAGSWPTDPQAVAHMELAMEIIRGVRNIRGEMNISPQKPVPVVLDCKSEAAAAIVAEQQGYIQALAKTASLDYGVGVERPAQSAVQLAGEVEILVPMAGLIDVAAEEQRLQKELQKAQKDVAFFDKKLNNPNFLDKAPAEVLAKDRAKQADAQEKQQVLQRSLERVQALKA